MRPVLWRLALVTLEGLLLGLEACTSTPSRFYILNALSASETTQPSRRTGSGHRGRADYDAKVPGSATDRDAYRL